MAAANRSLWVATARTAVEVKPLFRSALPVKQALVVGHTEMLTKNDLLEFL